MTVAAAAMAAAGRVLGFGESLLDRLGKAGASVHEEDPGQQDKTGRVARAPGPVPVRWREGDLLFPAYDSLAHSLWRAQELSLFNRVRSRLAGPVLDVGCGDGSFSSLLFDRLDIGLDKDPVALRAAKARGLYGRLLEGTDERIPLEDGAAGSALCNSVLEHVVDVGALLRELARVIRPGGFLAFTVPVKEFERQLSRTFGRRFSLDLNRKYFHRNLLEPADWDALLQRAGFETVESLPHQDAAFTFWYVLLRYAGSRRGLGRWFPGLHRALWAAWGGGLVSLVRSSVEGTAHGANLFVLARRTGPA